MKNTHGIVPALRQPYAQLDQPAESIDAQPTRQSVIQFAPRVAPQGDIQIAPQIFVPDIPAGPSNRNASPSIDGDDLCMDAMDEFEKNMDTMQG